MNRREEFIKSRERYFSDRNWELRECSQCLRKYFVKKHKKFDLCQSFECSKGYRFSGIPAPNKFTDLVEGVGNAKNHFFSREFMIGEPISMVRSNERTLFASAAGQVFDELIYGSSGADVPRRYFISQPVIRLQGLNQVGKMEAISSSFVHSSIVHWNATIDDYFIALDSWLDFFSSAGLYVGDLTFKVDSDVNDWAGKTVEAESVVMNYYGLEIGIANYFLDIPVFQKTVTMSDVGVGMERLLWAINKSGSYFDSMGPLTFAGKNNTILLDSIRTMVLMVGSGVLPAHKNHGFKLRFIANKISEPFYTFPLMELVDFYYAQWSKFIDLSQSLQAVNDVIKREVDRNANLSLNKILGRDDSCNLPHETFLQSLTKKMGIKKLMAAVENGGKP